MTRSIFQVKQACLNEIERAYKIVEAEYGVEIPRVPVEFSNRLKKCGGKAMYKRIAGHVVPHRIKLSMPILQLNPEVFVEDTPAHEAMHLAAAVVWGYDAVEAEGQGGHGRKWQSLMKLVDRDPSRTHNMKTVDTRVHAMCNCPQGHKISKVRANKIRRGTAAYGCNRCSAPLRLGGKATTHKVTKPRTEPRGMWTPPAKPAPKPVEAHPVVNTKTGVNAVCAMIKVLKKRGIELTMILDDAKVLSGIAAQAQITGAECRTMLKHNWSRV